MDALPQGQKMLKKGIFEVDKMLLETMRQSFLEIAVIDAVETRLTEPKTVSDCVSKLRTYLQDAHVAIGILDAFGPVQNIHLNPIRKVSDDKHVGQLFGSTSSPNKYKPQANAAGASGQKGKKKGEGKGEKDSSNPQSPQQQKPVDDGKCKFYLSDSGCKHGAKCTRFHPTLSRDDGKCYNCGAKDHSLKDCNRDQPPIRRSLTGMQKVLRTARVRPRVLPQIRRGRKRVLRVVLRSLEERVPRANPPPPVPKFLKRNKVRNASA
eukprot:6491530-Amphidinium_carterae.1